MSHELFCRVTDDLNRELKTLDGGKWARGSEGLLFPGVLLTTSSRLCAAIGFHIDAGAVLSVAEPMLCGPETPEIRSAWMSRLFEGVRAECSRRKCTSVRAIEPVTPHNEPEVLSMTDFGFSVKATICRWTKRVSSDSGSPMIPIRSDCGSTVPALQFVGCKRLAEDSELRQRVMLLLQQVFSDTTDLAALPSPKPDEMLKDWIQQGATLVLAENDNTLIGLCCVVAEEFDAAESLIDEIQIQYIGVASHFRKRRIASQLINAIPSIFSSETASVALMFASMAAFCDDLNEPAKRLYAANGFEQCGEFNVWCCNVETTDLQPILSAEASEL